MNKKLVISLVLLVAVVVALGVALPRPDKEVVKGPQGERGLQGPAGPQGPRGLQGLTGPRGPAGESKLGASPSPDTYFPYVGNNNVRKWTIKQVVRQATTTICAAQNPAYSTSTLVRAIVSLTTASSAATDLVIARGITAFATNTALASAAISAGIQGTLNVTDATSTTMLDRVTDIAPKATTTLTGAPSWVVVSIAGGDTNGAAAGAGTPTGLVPVGTCQFEFQDTGRP